MLKGHSTIELTDVKTGEVERYEDDNLVTNGLQYYARYKSVPKNVYLDWFSGIKLYDGLLEENPDIALPPANVKLIGYAGLLANTSSTARGLFNKSESGVLEDLSGVKLVWDFAQSQANGTIACVCITPNEFIDDSSGNYMASAEYSLCTTTNVNFGGDTFTGLVDFDTKRRIATTWGSDKSYGKISLAKSYVRFFYDSVLDTEYGSKRLEKIDITIPGYSSDYIGSMSHLGKDDEYYYFIAMKAYDSSSQPYTTTFLLTKIKIIDFTVETKEFVFSDPAYATTYFKSSPKLSFLFNKGIYLLNDSDSVLYKIRISDQTLEKAIDDTNIKALKYNQMFVLVRKDGVLFNDFTLDLNDNINASRHPFYSSYPGGYNELFYPIFNGLFFARTGSASVQFFKNNYLFTVNNLSSPVVKTADKTMKITYILREDYGDTPTPPTP